MDAYNTKYMDKVPWYNTTICTKLNGQNSEDYLKTGRKDRYYLMCSIDAYGKGRVSSTDGAISGGRRPIPSTSYKESILSLGQTINFINNGLQCFESNYYNIQGFLEEVILRFFNNSLIFLL